MSAASAAKSAERIDGAIFTAPLYRSLPSEPHGGEAVGAVEMRPATEHAVVVERQGKSGRRIEREVRARGQERRDNRVVLLRLERARRVDETAAGLHHSRRGQEDLPLPRAAG